MACWMNRSATKTGRYTAAGKCQNTPGTGCKAKPPGQPANSSFGANYTLNAIGQKFFTNSNTLWINSAYLGLNINVPIFDGFQRKYKIQQAELNVQKTENTMSR
jgi:hypothetical protein